VQVFGDTHGNVVHLFERDCSLQRRHQKVIEEAPAPGMDEATRKAVTDAAVLAAKAVNYANAGTVEFIADASEGLRADRVWFMEMNTRLQVEHPVTEEITGQDLVEWQLRVASGEKLPLRQEELKINGWAMEARLYAEDPDAGFLPSTGKLGIFQLPHLWRTKARVDAAVERGDEISPFYDPMIAKIIVRESNRDAAVASLREECAQIKVWPVRTNAGFIVRCLEDRNFSSGEVDTGLISSGGDRLSKVPAPSDRILRGAARSLVGSIFNDWMPAAGEKARRNPWASLEGFRLNSAPSSRVHLLYKAKSFDVLINDDDWASSYAMPGVGKNEQGKRAIIIFDRGEAYEFTLDTGERSADEAAASDGAILSPMPGKIVSVAVKAGAKLKKGDPILVLEAMKMEHTLVAPFDGKLAELNAKPGAQVSEGVLLAKLES
jgi:acetyl/propionyl-CoA carboxylase alpha subunit